MGNSHWHSLVEYKLSKIYMKVAYALVVMYVVVGWQAARAWHVDVAKWLLQHNCDVNKADSYGRTALHVAAAVDCPEMVNLFIEWEGVCII